MGFLSVSDAPDTSQSEVAKPLSKSDITWAVYKALMLWSLTMGVLTFIGALIVEANKYEDRANSRQTARKGHYELHSQDCFPCFRLVLSLLAIPTTSHAKTHKDNYAISCTALWPAVKDTLRNSGKYGILSIDASEMTASYIMGGNISAKRINSVVLNTQGSRMRDAGPDRVQRTGE